MSNAVLAAIGMGITMIAFAAFSVLQLGKADVAYPTVLADYGVRQTKDGRKVLSRRRRKGRKRLAPTAPKK